MAVFAVRFWTSIQWSYVRQSCWIFARSTRGWRCFLVYMFMWNSIQRQR